MDCQSPAISRERNSWVTVLLDFSAKQFITLLNVHGDVNKNRLTHEIHEH